MSSILITSEARNINHETITIIIYPQDTGIIVIEL
jgi:hypothetical protein